MIAIANRPQRKASHPRWQIRFLEMLPAIRRQAQYCFRKLPPEIREELVQETLANCYVACCRLAQRKKLAIARPSPLARFAVAQIRAGRRVGSQLNVQDILSPQSRRVHGLTIERLDQPDGQTGIWNQLVLEDRQAGPAETAAARMDLAAWFGTLSQRNRRIARSLALGEPTSVVARQFGLSPGRISQLRGWFRMHWGRFQSDEPLAGAAG